MQDYRKLSVWKKAHYIVIDLYRVTGEFPNSELFGLTSQTRRACVSIPANIAEGCGRNGGAELIHFLGIAQGSASELDYHLLLAKELGLVRQQDYVQLYDQLNEVRRMITSLKN